MTLKRKFACGGRPATGLRKSASRPFSATAIETLNPPSSRRDIRETTFLDTLLYSMSLLTPSESRAFQSFLDAAAFPVDWNMQLEISHEHMPPARGTEALTRATKDLMSLEPDKWRYPLGPYSSGEGSVMSVPRQQHLQANPLALLCSTRQQRSSTCDADDTGLVNPLSTHVASSDSLPLPLYHVIHSSANLKRNRTDSGLYDRSSSASSSSGQSPVDLLTTSSSTVRLPSLARRSPSPDAKLANKRHRPSASYSYSDEAQLLSQNRGTLLSPSQKKANHIQSEQKRRANIRRGYDALCEAVPALREACQADDEQQLADGKPKGRRRGKVKAKGDDGERADGRAGPRSENVVLSKTIEYLQELLSERETLTQRLHAARSALPVDHPLLHTQPDAPPPLWERKWTGGEEKGNEDDDDDDEEEE